MTKLKSVKVKTKRSRQDIVDARLNSIINNPIESVQDVWRVLLSIGEHVSPTPFNDNIIIQRFVQDHPKEFLTMVDERDRAIDRLRRDMKELEKQAAHQGGVLTGLREALRMKSNS
tara:strand:- start:28097 stop:28444 length:348 start_codon:yes stop_codon:yes gene_type:complete